MRNDDRKVIDEFVERARTLPGLEAIMLFGSLARGDEDKRSDIDLLVIVKAGAQEALVEPLMDIASSVDTDRPVRPVITDLSDYDPDFLQNALREGSVLFGKVVISPDTLALKPYTIISYSLKGMTARGKVAIHRAVHGYRVETRKGGRTYVSERSGLVDKDAVHKLGRGVIALPAEEARGFTRVLEELGASYSRRKVWL
ncbi:MAG: nucleotidyltransferase domain-containing protein [Methanopyri archaeon]|nr:nucleotidyltransferase domain-containing protein [Methanopyri archaeon]